MQHSTYAKPKRIRGSNFTKDEEELLLSEVEKFKKIIDSKLTDKISSTEKNQAWRQIAICFNAKNTGHRTIEQLKIKYDNFKCKLRRSAVENKTYFSSGDEAQLTKIPTEKENFDVITISDPEDAYRSDNSRLACENVSVVITEEEGTLVDDKIRTNNDVSLKRKFRTHPLRRKFRQVGRTKAEDHCMLMKSQYYEEEIKRSRLLQEDIRQQRIFTEQEHAKKMQLLDLEIKIKQKQLNDRQ